MGELLDVAYVVALVVALWANGLAAGLAHPLRQLVAPLRDARLVGAVALVDVALVPVLVWSLVRLLAVPDDHALGLLLVGIAAAGPLGIAVTQLARGDVPAAASLVVGLELGNLVAVPLWALLLLPDGVEVDVVRIVPTLLALVVAPILVGVAVRSRGKARVRLAPPLRVASLAGLVLVVAIVLVRDGDALGETLGERVPLVALLAFAVALALGWRAGGDARPTRTATALVTGVRASGPALAIAETSFPDRPGVRLGIVVYALVALVGSFAVALVLRGSPANDAVRAAVEHE